MPRFRTIPGFEEETTWQHRRRLGRSRARTRSRLRPAARAGRTCTPTTRASTRSAAQADEQRFWFWNSMHFPVPMPAFDAICVDSPYQAIGNWQNRVFAVPPAMGIDWRCINGYIYISGNPVLDPAKIGERAEYFQARAGYYYANWDELYGKWRVKMDALIVELGELAGSGARRVRARRGRVRGRRDELLRRDPGVPARAAAPRPDVAAPLRVPAARLRRVHDLRRAVQGEPAGHPGPAHRADGRGPRRAALPARPGAAPARAPRDRHRRRRRVRRGALARGDRRRARPRAKPGARGSPSSSR